tara:strand:+ start:553 stop:1866 length:1314 start_codon:yes stop_codon:yes gene_type:complete
MGCESLFDNDSQHKGSSFAHGGNITQALIDSVGSKDYIPNTNLDPSEVTSVHSTFRSFYINHKDEIQNRTEYEAILEIFEDVQDNYSQYFDPIQAQILMTDFETPDVRGLIGIEILDGDTLKIKRIYPNSPAAEAGLEVGDFIIKANGIVVHNTEDNLLTYFENTEGGSGTNVVLRVIREKAFFTFSMTKENVALPTVFVDSLTQGVSIIQVTIFEDQTLEIAESDTSGTWLEFRNALTTTQDEQVTVIDLRSNPGGFVNICTNMADELVGEELFYIGHEINDGVFSDDTIIGTTGGLAENRKFILLANGGSASCSELFIEAVTKNSDTPLIGVQTYGKGIAQGFFRTIRDGILKTTTLQYYDGAGVSYHGLGHRPDYIIEDPDAQLAKAVELANQITGFTPPLSKILRSKPYALQLLLESRLSEKVPHLISEYPKK